MTRTAVAAAVSIGLHAGALVLLLGRTPAAPKPVAGAAPNPVQVEVLRLAAVMSPRKPNPAPAAVAAPAPRPPRSPREQSRGEATAAPAEAPEPVAVAVEPSEPAGPVEAAPAPAPAPTLDTSALSRRLQEVAARCYPPAARRFHQTGEAEVRFCLDAAGALAETTVSRSSGSELLDRAASGCVVPGAAPFGAETYGRCFTVPVRFHQ